MVVRLVLATVLLIVLTACTSTMTWTITTHAVAGSS